MGATTAVVLAAGLGTRMRPLTDHIPKPALPFLNRPALHWTLESLAEAGVEKTLLNLHHLAEVTAGCARSSGTGMELRFFCEPEILGTAGLFWPMAAELDAPYFFVVNGDIWGDLPLKSLSREMEAHPECLAALAVKPLPSGSNYTPLNVDSEGILLEFGTGNRFFTGVYAARKELLKNLPGPGFLELVSDVLKPQLTSRAIRAVDYIGEWFDLGSPQAYLEAQFAVLVEVAAGSRPLSAGSLMEELGGFPVLRHATARLSPQAEVLGPLILGEGCEVPAGCHLGSALLLPGTTLFHGENLSGAIALGDLRVQVTR